MRRFILAGLLAGHALMAGSFVADVQAKGSIAQIARTQSELGFRLLELLAGSDASPSTIMVSPASVAAALASLDLVADERMHAALTKALGFGAVTAETPLEVLRTSARDLTSAEPGKGPLVFANGVFFDPAGRVRPQAIERFKAEGVEAYEVQLGTMAGIDAVNAWGAKHTAGRIPTILAQPLENPILVLLDAFHFKDVWEHPFSPRETAGAPFKLVDDGTVAVQMMRQTYLFGVREDDRFIAVTLPYRTRGADPGESPYSLTVVTTKDVPAKLADFAAVVDWLPGNDLHRTGTALSLPRFSASVSADLLRPLERLGLAQGYSPTAFASLSEKSPVISAILQRTIIRVDEEGTEAAGLTGVKIQTSGFRSDKTVMFDKPFVFALIDRRHGLVLMEGYVGNPATP